MSEEVVKDEEGTGETEDTGTVITDEKVAGDAGSVEDAGKGEAGKADSGETEKEAGAPEAYEDFNLPEGMVVNEELMGEFVSFAKESNLSQEVAQKLVDMQTKELAKSAEAQAKAWTDINDKWVEAAKSDKEFGGPKFSENISVAKKALDTYGTPELREALEVTGAGNHPEFLRFMYRVGKTIKEDTVHSGQAGKAPTDAAKLLFPNQN